MKKLIICTVVAVGTFFTVNSQITNSLKIKIRGGEFADETIIRFKPDATEGYDMQYDAYKLFGLNPDAPSLYTKASEQYSFAINSLPKLNRDYEVDVHLLLPIETDYIIEFVEMLPFNNDVRIYIKDNFTGEAFVPDFNEKYIVPYDKGSTKSPRFNITFSTDVQKRVSPTVCYGQASGTITVSDYGNHNFNATIRTQSGGVVVSQANINETETITGIAAGNYILETTSSYGYTESFGFTIIQPPPIIASFTASASIIYLSETNEISFYNNSSKTTGCQWNFGDESISNDINPVHTYSDTGIYTVTLTMWEGKCSAIKTMNITVKSEPPIQTTYVNEINGNSFGLSVYPNPNNGVFQLKIKTEDASPSLSMTVYNVLGEKIYQSSFYDLLSKVVDLSNHPKGIYLVSIENKGLSETLKVIVK